MSLTAQTGSSQRADRDVHSRAASDDDPTTDGLFANLDPALHPATLNSVGGTETQNPLTHFAQHVLDEHDGALLGFGVGPNEDGSSLFTSTGEARFGELLEAADQSERTTGLDGTTNGSHADTFTFGTADSLDASVVVAGVEEDTTGLEDHTATRLGSRLVGRKRRREGDENVVGPVENGEPLDPIKMKKDSHKEVERRRRENISDGINELARLIPGGMEKIGKGQLLRRAVDYLAEMVSKIGQHAEELAAKESEKEAIQTELTQTHVRLAEEHARSMRFETSWREAEDRAASSQFELDRARTELEELKKTVAEAQS